MPAWRRTGQSANLAVRRRQKAVLVEPSRPRRPAACGELRRIRVWRASRVKDSFQKPTQYLRTAARICPEIMQTADPRLRAISAPPLLFVFSVAEVLPLKILVPGRTTRFFCRLHFAFPAFSFLAEITSSRARPGAKKTPWRLTKSPANAKKERSVCVVPIHTHRGEQWLR